jgi:hypothetical protein
MYPNIATCLRCEFEYHSVKVYSIQHYVIKYVSDLRQVGGFLRVLLFPPPIKLTSGIQTHNVSGDGQIQLPYDHDDSHVHLDKH